MAKDHSNEPWGLTVTEPLGKPLHLRHLAKYSPLLSALYKKWLLFSPRLPTAYDFKLIYTIKKKYYWRNRKYDTLIERENLPSCLADDTMKVKPQTQLCCPLVFSVTLAVFKEIDTIIHDKGCYVFKSRDLQLPTVWLFLKVKISSVQLIKFTEAAVLKNMQHISPLPEQGSRHRGWTCGQYVEMCMTWGGSMWTDYRIHKITTQILEEKLLSQTLLHIQVGLTVIEERPQFSYQYHPVPSQTSRAE